MVGALQERGEPHAQGSIRRGVQALGNEEVLEDVGPVNYRFVLPGES